MPSGSDAVLDPEAARLPPRAGRTCRLQTWALSAALLLLAAACAAFAVRSCWVPAGRASPGASPAPSSRLPDDPELLPNDRLPDPLQGDGAFAQLVARDAQLSEGRLHWYSEAGLKGVYLAPGLSYDEQTQELVVAKAGTYYVLFSVELHRVVNRAGSDWVSTALHLQPPREGTAALALTLDLPPLSSEACNSVTGSWGGQLHLGAGQRLSVHLNATTGAQFAWQLAQGATVLCLTQRPRSPLLYPRCS
ncbi:tumor necrosis factor ligand superfamily member 9 [Rousettus aegyptiacus]|uniref:TNF superfamily member 9 n=1 Tax=Rousettus aegyptiacus TaxID=9407 RepID=A0A7J8BWR0_ROUAE|nr:tumor necrosis factor ligand superfamily member 9 [Rousettus aegyptiacus]KAF6402750.1 TNF superfamily member 9 [Rousettus aegyptiacus]